MNDNKEEEKLDEVGAPGLSVVLTNLDNLVKILTTVNKTAKSEKLEKSRTLNKIKKLIKNCLP